MSATTRATATKTTSLAATGRNTKSTPSLWDTANSKLDTKSRKSLASVNVGNGRVVDAVLKEAVTEQRALSAKRWKATIGGREVILRDVLAKIIRWVDHLKAVGDIAVQFNSGAASLPWAAVRFLLQVAVNDKQYLEATIEGIEMVTQKVATYAAMEDLYMDSDFQLHTQIRSKVLGLYVHILSFLAESIQYFKTNTPSRTAKGAFSTNQGERLRQIAKHDTEVRQLAKMCDSHVQRLIRTDVMRIDENIMTSLKAQSFRDFVAWLSLTPYREHHVRHSKHRLHGTTQWLTNDSRYVDWKSSASSSLLWLRGILGSGKTNLISAVIDDSLHSTNARSLVLYYYCSDIKGHGGRCDAKDVMRSLLRQLTVKNEETFEIVEQVHLEFRRREARGKVGMGDVDKLEPHECTHWIAQLLQTDEVVIIIDAIDEIDVTDRHLLLKELIALRDDPGRVTKMMLSSRDDTNLAQWLEGATELHLRTSLTQADMQHFISHCVSMAVENKYLLDGKVDPPFQSELESYFLHRADGMFRWVELQLRHFCDLKFKPSIEQAMSDTTGASTHTVNQLYATIFDGIFKTDPLAYSIAAQTFRLMLCLHETISPTALLAAASITRDGLQNSLELSDLLRICSHLVILDDELDTIRFAHASVQEYLLRHPEFSTMNANSAVASSCLTRCVDSLLPDLTLGVQPSRDFDVYAAMYWPLHYNAASEHDRDGYLRDALEEFMFSNQDFMSPFPSWIETVDEIVKILSGPHARLSDMIAVGSESATPFFTACIYGLEFAIEILSRTSSFDVDQKNARGNTGLYLASAAGQIRVVDVLLRLGADIAIEGGRHTTPLQAACANGHGDIAQLIIDFSNQQITTGLMASAIQAALRNGYEDVAVILLKRNAVPMSQDTLDQVFEAAAGMGFAELMQYLHLTSKSLSGSKKLVIKGAVKIFHDTKLEWFRNYFQHKALPNDAVATAAFYGQNKIVELFLDKGLDIEQEGPFGTPLRAASLMGHGTTVRLLLNRDAMMNENGPFGDALQAAAMRGHLSITTMLIQSGVAVDNSGGYYGNALQAATYRGHIDVVKALLAAGASIGQKGLFSDALSAAVSAGNQPITNLLLQSGYRSPHLVDEDEIVMLSAARHRMSSTSHVDLLSALDSTHHSKRTRQADPANTRKGRDFSFEEAYKRLHEDIEMEGVMGREDHEHYKQYESNALLVATVTGQESVVRSMLDYRSAIGLSLSDIGVALKVASAAGQLDIVDHILLLPDLPEQCIPRALERAAWYGHVAVMKRLLQCEEAYGPPPDSGYTPFTPREDTRYKRVHSDKKKTRWSDYFPLSYEAVDTNETAEMSHIMRILLLGCRGNAPATVELALQLAAESVLQDLFATALAITIGSNSELALEVLLRHHPTIEATMLKEACTQAEKEESLRVLYVLLQHNSDHGYRVQDYWNVYNGADRTKHSSLISYLDTQTLNWQDDSVFAQTFVEAAQRGYVSALKSWERRLFQLFNYDLLMSRALDQACANGHAVVASYLIELGADVNTIIEKPMESSGPIKHRRVPRRSYGTDKIQVWPRTALQACLQATPQYDRVQGIPIYSLKEFKDRKQNFLNKQQEVIQLLLRKKADANFVDSHGRSALHYAALYCSVETVRTILESGAAVDILDKDDKTPLFYAAWRELDSFAVLKVLTKAEEQARPSATRTSPALLLDAALSVFKNGFVESESVRQVLTTGSGAVIRYLLQSQTDLQATATGFPLLLQMASADVDFELVRLLIERIVDVKAVCHCYGTALHAAARFGHLDCVKLLVEVGTEIALAAGNFRWTPLRAAVEGQHLAIVQFLLDSGAMQSCSDFTNQGLARYSRRDSTLTSACRSGSVDLVKLLLSYSEQPTLMPGQKGIRRTQFVDMASALQGACENGHVEIVALLIEYGADIEQEYGRFSSPLTAAAAAGDLETMKVLLAAGATLYDAERAINILRTLVVRDKPKDTIDYVLTRLLHTDDFIYACREIPAYVRAWQEDAKFVLHVQTMQSSDRLLANLAALGAQRSIELLMESSIDMAEVRPAMLQAAAYFQSYNILFELLPMVVIPQPLPLIYQSPAYAMLAGFMPIQLKTDSIHKNLCCEAWATNSFLYSWIPGRLDKECACSNARTAASEAILKLAQIDESHICASAGILHLASYLGMLQVVQLCLDLGVKIDQRHESFGSALIAGIEGDSFDVVVMLLQRHIDVNTTSDDIGTPLYPTRQTRNMAGRRFVDYKTPGTGTALHRVCQNKDLAMAELLLQHGAEVNVLIPGKGTSMHVACEKKDEKLLKLLLRYGADVDIVSPDLGSALHVTCKSHSAGLAEILLQHGANVNVFSSNHGTPLHAACADKGDDATIQLLLKHGADVNSKGSNGDSVLTSILSRRICSFERSLGSLLGTEQQSKATGSDLDRSMAEFVYSKSEIQICKRVLADNKHLEPTIEMVRSALARSKYLDSDILRLLLARVPHLNITLEMVKNAQDLESFELLTKHGSGIEIMLDLMRSFLDPLELNLIKYSVQSAPEIRPPPAVVTRIRAILDQPETEATGTVYEDELTFRRYPRNNQKPIAKEIMGLILVRYPDIEVLHTTNETNESHQSDTEK